MSFPHSSLNAHKPAHLIQKLRVALRGDPLLNSPRFNKGTAFSPRERKALGLHGRLPYRENTLEHQCERAYEQLQARDTAIRKNTFLQSLRDQNWTLYFALLQRHLKELVPVIYTPTQGDAIASYSHLFRKPDGLFLTFKEIDRMEEEFLEQTRGKEIDLVVCTDAEAILGIGDQGVGGIGISTAKSAMYTLIGGLDPSKTLAVMLDVGTNNEQLLNDPLYVGWPHRRVTGEDYDKFVDKFVQLVRKYYPHSLLHFEDFGVNNAYRLLHKYRETHAAFNDDILTFVRFNTSQGTGAVTLACIMAAIGVSSRSSAASTGKTQGSRLSDQRYVIFGAGSAGMGIAVQVRDAMVTADGISRKEANRRFWLIDREGLLYDHTGEEVKHNQEWTGAKAEFVRPFEEGWGKSAQSGSVGLLETVKKVKPTVLIGCSTAAGAFTEEVVKAMDQGLTNGEKPIIMPLSNPSRLVEAQPVDIMKWTEGRALVATGSPFGTVEMKVGGKDKSFRIAECNNALIYPGLGFGAILAQSRKVTDSMLIAGAQRLARLSPAIEAAPSKDALAKSSDAVYEYNGEALLPDFAAAPQVNYEIGVAVAQQAVVEGTASSDWLKRSGSADDLADSEVRDMMLDEVRERAERKVWVPVYAEYEYDPNGVSD
ncbi:hypothetical protein DFP72DRAFT_1142945 [Ephemerocybe angulata]|uniref:Malic enzyme n=1 Tax=Ephemerocybe angulata TaxID=980116 RepID=A0A8H6M106_9AGAR|nr:hypothetical protein DFP72DRAFT_1142945 [Tulosesus angulatus]